jgi:hypothetical protein
MTGWMDSALLDRIYTAGPTGGLMLAVFGER